MERLGVLAGLELKAVQVYLAYLDRKEQRLAIVVSTVKFCGGSENFRCRFFCKFFLYFLFFFLLSLVVSTSAASKTRPQKMKYVSIERLNSTCLLTVNDVTVGWFVLQVNDYIADIYWLIYILKAGQQNVVFLLNTKSAA